MHRTGWAEVQRGRQQKGRNSEVCVHSGAGDSSDASVVSSSYIRPLSLQYIYYCHFEPGFDRVEQV